MGRLIRSVVGRPINVDGSTHDVDGSTHDSFPSGARSRPCSAADNQPWTRSASVRWQPVAPADLDAERVTSQLPNDCKVIEVEARAGGDNPDSEALLPICH
jgi:hypothetical protein